MQLDILYIHSNASAEIYQSLSESHSAIETPIWAGMLANHVRTRNFSTQILDCEAEGLNHVQAAKIIKDINPRIACLVVYGQQPSASTQNMEGAIALVKEIKAISNIKTLMVGGHIAALPNETLAYKDVDFIAQNEGVYTISDLLSCDDLDNPIYLEKIAGLGWKKHGMPQLNTINPIVKQDMLETDLPGVAWDLLPPPSKYRTAGWHSWPNNSEKSPFASLYTSLGCPFKCLPADTKVMVFDTKHKKFANKSIQNIKVGHTLLAYDEQTGKLAETKVIHLVRNEEKEGFVKIKFENGKFVEATPEHPFYVNDQWIEARALKVGDEICSVKDGNRIIQKAYSGCFQTTRASSRACV